MGRINIYKKQKGFTYIIITLILIIFITLLFMLFKELPTIDKTTNNLSQNYIIELKYLIENDLNTNNIDLLNKAFYNYSRSHNYDVNICTIIDDGKENLYISNYLQQTINGIEDQNTVKVNKNLYTNYINFGECYLDFNATDKTSYYISFISNSGKKVYKNQYLPI
jgi:competence protein ComGC